MRKIRVLQIITRLIVGGAQETVMLVADMLDKSRFEVDVLSGPQTGSEGSLQEAVRERGISLTIMPELVREISPVKDLAALYKMYRFIKHGNYDIIHTNSSKAGVLGRIAGRLVGTPIVVHTVHGWSFHNEMSALERNAYVLLERFAANLCDHLVVVSPKDIDKGLAVGIAEPDKYSTIRSGIELDRFMNPGVEKSVIRESLGISNEVPVVGTVTRLSPQKAPQDFIVAASLVAKAVPTTRFIVVGDGPLRGEIEELIEKLDLANNIVLTGLRRDVPQLLKAFDVFVLSSLWEGLPRVLPQAMAAGLPIVATMADGNAEAIEDGINGFLVPAGDRAALADKTLQLLRDMDGAEQMGIAGQRKVPAFGAKKMVEDMEKLYFSLALEKGLETV